MGEEPWKITEPPSPIYLPLEAKVGDQVLFLRKAAIEIQFAGEGYLIVPHGAILVLARDDKEEISEVSFREEDFEL